MTRTERLLAILQDLRNHKLSVHARILAERFTAIGRRLLNAMQLSRLISAIGALAVGRIF